MAPSTRVNTQSKSAAAKATVPLDTLVRDRPLSTFFALAIVGGLALRLLDLVVMSLMTANVADNVVSFTGCIMLMLWAMAVYKRANNMRVVW